VVALSLARVATLVALTVPGLTAALVVPTSVVAALAVLVVPAPAVLPTPAVLPAPVLVPVATPVVPVATPVVLGMFAPAGLRLVIRTVVVRAALLLAELVADRLADDGVQFPFGNEYVGHVTSPIFDRRHSTGVERPRKLGGISGVRL
jgi:hypothetical protein